MASRNNILRNSYYVFMGVWVTILVVFCAFFYFPAREELATSKARLQQTLAGIDTVNRVMAGMDAGKAYLEFTKEVRRYKGKMPPKEEAVNILDHMATSLGIDVENISVGSPVACPADSVLGYECNSYSVSMSMEANFRAFGEYLSILNNRCPIFVRFKGFVVQAKNDKAMLDIKLDLQTYTLEKKG